MVRRYHSDALDKQPWTMPGQSRWLDHDDEDRAVLAKPSALSAGIPFVWLTCFFLIADAHLTPWLGVPIAVCFGAFAIVFDLRRGVPVLSPPAPEDPALDLLEDPDDPSVCLVTIGVYQNGYLTGTDRGVAYIEDGALIFAGDRTSFVIGGQDLLPRDKYLYKDSYTANITCDVAVGLRHADRRIALAISKVSRPYGKEIKSALEFMPALRTWRDSRPQSSLDRQYPPLAVHKKFRPSPIEPTWRRISQSCFMFVVAVFVGAGLNQALVWALPASVVVGLAGAIWMYWYETYGPPEVKRRFMLAIEREER